jgi:hypothetical protein
MEAAFPPGRCHNQSLNGRGDGKSRFPEDILSTEAAVKE